MSRPPETSFLPHERPAFLRRVARAPVVGLWRWEVVDETGRRMHDHALVRFANGRSWIGELEGEAFSALLRSLGREQPQTKSHGPAASAQWVVRRVPRFTLLNAYLLVLLLMLVAVVWMGLFDGEPEPLMLLYVGLPVGFVMALAAVGMGPWRSRIEVGQGRLRVFHGRELEAACDLNLDDLRDLWLRELHPDEQQAPLRRGTPNTLHLMARTRDGQTHELLCLRSRMVSVVGRDALLAWVEGALGRNGVGSEPRIHAADGRG